METRQMKAVLKATPIKTDRRNAIGLARLLRMGWFRPVHCKSIYSQEVRPLLSGRKAVLSAILNLENAVRGLLRNFGLKVGEIGKVGFEARIRELAEGNPRLEAMVEAILRSRRRCGMSSRTWTSAPRSRATRRIRPRSGQEP